MIKAPLVCSIQGHDDTINSIDFCLTKNDKLLIIIASADCSVSLYDLTGEHIGKFGQDSHWKLDNITSYSSTTIESLVNTNQLAALNQSSDDTVDSITINIEDTDTEKSEQETQIDGSDIEKPTKNTLMLPKLEERLQAENTFEYENDAFVNDPSLRYNPWAKTILGKCYQESRTQKRDRRQPGLIETEEFQIWDKTGQAPGGLYGVINF
jgi:WD repeat-containing protein 49